MASEADMLEIESERTFLVYDKKTGSIVHIHRLFTHRGAESLTDAQGEARALEIANRFGQSGAELAVLGVDEYDSSIPRRVDVKTRQLAAQDTH